MKISEYKNFNRFLTMLFTFFKDNGIESSIYPLDDYDAMLKRVFDCEYVSMSYYPGMYGIDFRLPERIEEGEVYMFLFGKDNSPGSSLLIDFGERDLVSFFNFSCDFEKHPPYLLDFADENGQIAVSSEVPGYDAEYLQAEDIMNFDEFIIYLNNNLLPKQLNIIVLDD